MKKLVNGELINMTIEERIARQNEEAAALTALLPKYLENYRYGKEIGGITLNGVHIQTDRETRANLIGARISAKEDNTYTIDWKTPSGFATLTAAQIIAISDAVAAHVKKCFQAEKAVLQSINQYTSIAQVAQAFDEAYLA